MSVICLQVGQCGNQLGQQLLNTLLQEASSGSTSTQRAVAETFFREPRGPRRGGRGSSSSAAAAGGSGDASPGASLPQARAVLVDTEAKVVSKCLESARRTGRWAYDPGRTTTRQSGAANNWANGYMRQGPQLGSEVANAVRLEAEACDRLQGVLVLQSAGGGTGSGLGSFLTEELRDSASLGGAKSLVSNVVVCPFRTGEVTVQYYNSLLTLAHLAESSDAAFLFQNDHMARICSERLGAARVGLPQINAVLARHLASVLLPVAASSPSSSLSGGPQKQGRDAAVEEYGGGSDDDHATSRRREEEKEGKFRAGRRRGGAGGACGAGIAGGAGGGSDGGSGGRRWHCLRNPVEELSRPGLRFLDVKMTPHLKPEVRAFSQHTWPGLLKRLLEMQVAGSYVDEGFYAPRRHAAGGGVLGQSTAGPEDVTVDHEAAVVGNVVGRSARERAAAASSLPASAAPRPLRSAGNIVYLRGSDIPDHLKHGAGVVAFGGDGGRGNSREHVVAEFQDPRLRSTVAARSTLTAESAVAAFSPQAVLTSSDRFSSYTSTASLLANSQATVPVLERVVDRAADLLEARAYVHQYERLGVGRDHLEEALESARQVLTNYRGI